MEPRNDDGDDELQQIPSEPSANTFTSSLTASAFHAKMPLVISVPSTFNPFADPPPPVCQSHVSEVTQLQQQQRLPSIIVAQPHTPITHAVGSDDGAMARSINGEVGTPSLPQPLPCDQFLSLSPVSNNNSGDRLGNNAEYPPLLHNSNSCSHDSNESDFGQSSAPFSSFHRVETASSVPPLSTDVPPSSLPHHHEQQQQQGLYPDHQLHCGTTAAAATAAIASDDSLTATTMLATFSTTEVFTEASSTATTTAASASPCCFQPQQRQQQQQQQCSTKDRNDDGGSSCYDGEGRETSLSTAGGTDTDKNVLERHVQHLGEAPRRDSIEEYAVRMKGHAQSSSGGESRDDDTFATTAEASDDTQTDSLRHNGEDRHPAVRNEDSSSSLDAADDSTTSSSGSVGLDSLFYRVLSIARAQEVSGSGPRGALRGAGGLASSMGSVNFSASRGSLSGSGSGIYTGGVPGAGPGYISINASRSSSWPTSLSSSSILSGGGGGGGASPQSIAGRNSLSASLKRGLAPRFAGTLSSPPPSPTLPDSPLPYAVTEMSAFATADSIAAAAQGAMGSERGDDDGAAGAPDFITRWPAQRYGSSGRGFSSLASSDMEENNSQHHSYPSHAAVGMESYCQLRTRCHERVEERVDPTTGEVWEATVIEVEELPSAVRRVNPVLEAVEVIQHHSKKKKGGCGGGINAVVTSGSLLHCREKDDEEEDENDDDDEEESNAGAAAVDSDRHSTPFQQSSLPIPVTPSAPAPPSPPQPLLSPARSTNSDRGPAIATSTTPIAPPLLLSTQLTNALSSRRGSLTVTVTKNNTRADLPRTPAGLASFRRPCSSGHLDVKPRSPTRVTFSEQPLPDTATSTASTADRQQIAAERGSLLSPTPSCISANSTSTSPILTRTGSNSKLPTSQKPPAGIPSVSALLSSLHVVSVEDVARERAASKPVPIRPQPNETLLSPASILVEVLGGGNVPGSFSTPSSSSLAPAPSRSRVVSAMSALTPHSSFVKSFTAGGGGASFDTASTPLSLSLNETRPSSAGPVRITTLNPSEYSRPLGSLSTFKESTQPASVSVPSARSLVRGDNHSSNPLQVSSEEEPSAQDMARFASSANCGSNSAATSPRQSLTASINKGLRRSSLPSMPLPAFTNLSHTHGGVPPSPTFRMRDPLSLEATPVNADLCVPSSNSNISSGGDGTDGGGGGASHNTGDTKPGTFQVPSHRGSAQFVVNSPLLQLCEDTERPLPRWSPTATNLNLSQISTHNASLNRSLGSFTGGPSSSLRNFQLKGFDVPVVMAVASAAGTPKVNPGTTGHGGTFSCSTSPGGLRGSSLLETRRRSLTCPLDPGDDEDEADGAK